MSILHRTHTEVVRFGAEHAIYLLELEKGPNKFISGSIDYPQGIVRIWTDNNERIEDPNFTLSFGELLVEIENLSESEPDRSDSIILAAATKAGICQTCHP